MTRLRYNGLTTTLGAAIAAGETAVTFADVLTHAAGDVPTIAAGDYIPLSLLDAEGQVAEIVHLTAYTAGTTTGTITRGEESTTDQAHDSGATVYNAPTVADFTTQDSGSNSSAAATVWRDTSLTVPTGVVTAIPFTVEAFDTGAFYDAAAPTRLTVPAGMAGEYIVSAQLAYTEGSGTSPDRDLFIMKNGVVHTHTGSNPGASGQRRSIGCSVVLSLAEGDYIELAFYHNSGADRTTNIQAGRILTWLSIAQVTGGGSGGAGGSEQPVDALSAASVDPVLGTERKWGLGLPAQSSPALVLTDDGTHFPVNAGVDYLSMFNAGAVLSTPLDQWYAYAATHDDAEIWLLTAPDPLGPWTWQQVVMSTTLSALLAGHMSSPHVLYKDAQVILTYHGEVGSTQPTVLATSADGVTFTEQGSIAFPAATNALRFYSRSTSYLRVVDAGHSLVAVFQANRTEANTQVGDVTTAVGWAVSDPTDGLTWRINRRPLIGNEPGSRGPFSPALIRLHGQWLLLALQWEENTIHGWVSDTLAPGSFVPLGPLVTSIPHGTRIYHPEAVFHDGKLLIFYTADDGTSNGGRIYCNTIDWKAA